jgi:hypothetical protein
LFKGNRVQKAEHSDPAVCIKQTDCGTTDRSNSDKKWRCDAWTPKPDRNNYRDTLDKKAEAKFDSDMERSTRQSEFERRKFMKEPYGWDKDTYISLEKIGLTTSVI